MSEQQHVGFVKIFRQILLSTVSQNDSVFAAFIKILLLVDSRSGIFITNIKEFTEFLNYGSKNTTYKTLLMLEKCRVIKIEKYSKSIKIIVPNWHLYQQKNSFTSVQKVNADRSKSERSEVKKCTLSVQKVNADRSKSERLASGTHNSVPVMKYVKEQKEYKELLRKEGADKPRGKKSFSESKPFLDLIDPKTDLEKLIAFYLKGVGNPAFKKPDANQILNKAINNDIPHYEAILNQTESLNQAQDIVADYVNEAKGTYSAYYLARQIDSRRQMWEEKYRRK